MSGPTRDQAGRRSSPTSTFLGERAAMGGPFALLGVDPRSISDAAILDARDRRMRQIDEHPLAETPEADEVRLSLYAAAAQLLNPSVRARLVESWGAVAAPAQAPSEPRPAPAAPPPGARGLSTHERLLEHDAILALAMFGGWNKRSLRRIASIAHARGLGSADVASTLRRIGHRRRPRPRRAAPSAAAAAASGPPPSFGEKPDPGTPLDEQIDPAQRLLKMAALVAAIAIITTASLVVGVIGLMSLADQGSAPTIVDRQGDGRDAPTSSRAPAGDPSRGAPTRARDLPDPGALGDPELVIKELEAARRALDLTPFEATRRFSNTVTLFASTWVAFPTDDRERGLRAVEQFLESVSPQPDASRLAIDAVGAGLAPLTGAGAGHLDESEIWPAVWSAGVLARVRSSPLLDASQRAQGDRLLRRAAPEHASTASGFIPGGVMGARLVADTLARAPHGDQAWTRWIESVDALAGENETVRTILLTEALEDLLAPPAGQVEARRPAIERTALALSWRRGSGARRWLVRTLEMPGATSGALSHLVAALASRSAAPGIDPTVSLGPNADMRERTALRERLEAAWRLDQAPELDSLTGDIRAAMNDLFRERTLVSDPHAQLTLAVRLALLNASVSLARDGAFEEAADAVRRSDAIRRSRPAHASDAAPLAPDSGSDGAWAMRFALADSDANERLSLLNRLADRGGGGIGPIDAETLVATAVHAAPRLVEERARQTLRQFLDAPAVVNALLEQLPEMPRSAEMIEIIELATQTPISRDARDGAWKGQSHRALVAALIRALAGESSWGAADEHLPDLYDAYHLSATSTPSMEDAAVVGSPREAARLLRLRWARESRRAGPTGLLGLDADAIERRRVARLELAPTPIHEFLAEQIAACESLALLTSSERAGLGAEVQGVLDTLGVALEASSHVATQIAACEEAIARIWLIREEVGQ